MREQYRRVTEALSKAGVPARHFGGVAPNPTVETIAAGARRAINGMPADARPSS